MSEFSDTLIAWRKRNTISQAVAAHLLGVHLRSISRWEAGHSEPPMARAKRMISIMRNIEVPEEIRSKQLKPGRPSKRKIIMFELDGETVLLERRLSSLDWLVENINEAKYIKVKR